MRGLYISGEALLKIACQVRGYYWVKQIGSRSEGCYAIFDGNDKHLGGADSLPKCKQFVVRDFKEWIEELVKGI